MFGDQALLAHALQIVVCGTPGYKTGMTAFIFFLEVRALDQLEFFNHPVHRDTLYQEREQHNAKSHVSKHVYLF